MTRINLVPPSELHGKHLVAEYYELPEIFILAQKRMLKGHTPEMCEIPAEYCFGIGHKRFFYNKLKFLDTRLTLLVEEMHNRGYQTQAGARILAQLPLCLISTKSEWWCDWIPPEHSIELSRARLRQRAFELGLT